MLGKNFITTLTDEKRGYENGRIDYTFLKEKIDNFKTLLCLWSTNLCVAISDTHQLGTN
jgi:hypothetical protein